MTPPPLRLVADVGNSRLKWGRLGPDGTLDATRALPVDEPAAWAESLEDWNPSNAAMDWAISSVNPPVADQLAAFLRSRGARSRLTRSAAEVPVRHELERPESTGADRAWAVLAASAMAKGPGLVVSCGTALTVERIGPGGAWQGGAIAPGLGLMARALNQGTAQLPRVEVRDAPPAWGRSTAPALAAGIFWAAVGAARELVARQAEGLGPGAWRVWTGGDASILAPRVDGPAARIEPDLVLRGLARAGFGPTGAGP